MAGSLGREENGGGMEYSPTTFAPCLSPAPHLSSIFAKLKGEMERCSPAPNMHTNLGTFLLGLCLTISTHFGL